ncbi:MAG: proline--tRNA ligase [Candidatus Borkfalkiaceae bacterium]|nr:proline--tRNA ligase [Christensenellaceae bacterium]
MLVRELLGKRYKETPKDCVIASHSLMMKGGYMKYMSAGSYSLFMPAKRITHKIEDIIRKEMDSIGGQEVLFPVVMPATLWEESGRYTSIGSEMARFTDRNGNKMVLGMTHEEAAVHLARDVADSYTDYPFMIYQIQTKFRDEPRARGGLIRVREFTMKDAYSFHTSQADLEKYYEVCYEAYNRIFRKCGAKNFIAVKSDSGMMGGSVSHEYMLLTDIGEDTLAICTGEGCDYKANVEVAECITHNIESEVEPLEKIATPHASTIDDVCKMLKVDPVKSIKAVVYQINETDEYVVVFIRGDLEVNETKLRNYLKKEVHPAVITAESGIVAGFIGPRDFKGKAKVVYDKSLIGIESFVAGANEEGYHYKGLNIARDVGKVEYVEVAKAYNGGVCPVCGRPTITLKRGVEIGNIFQLGQKYTKSMNMTYIDKDGERKYPYMGCYGIGVGRLAATICEEQHDKFGPVWPITIAPWQVEICCLQATDEKIHSVADKLYKDLNALGVETLYDDRDERPGSMFADADLFGIPVRAVVSAKNCEKGVVEISYRDKSYKGEVAIEKAAEEIAAMVKNLLGQYNI